MEKGFIIRKATGEEMLALWGVREIKKASPTAKFFYDNISTGNTVFWTLDHDGELLGELYVFLNLEDKDFADGRNTAYLCAFRVKKEYRGQGYGSRLIATALEDLKQIGFCRATIGVGTIPVAWTKICGRDTRKPSGGFCKRNCNHTIIDRCRQEQLHGLQIQ